MRSRRACLPSQSGVLVLHGQAGVGKSELACEYAALQARYPGGTFFIAMAGSLPRSTLSGSGGTFCIWISSLICRCRTNAGALSSLSEQAPCAADL